MKVRLFAIIVQASVSMLALTVFMMIYTEYTSSGSRLLFHRKVKSRFKDQIEYLKKSDKNYNRVGLPCEEIGCILFTDAESSKKSLEIDSPSTVPNPRLLPHSEIPIGPKQPHPYSLHTPIHILARVSLVLPQTNRTEYYL